MQENSSQNNDNGQSSEIQSSQQGHLSDTTASAAGSDDEDTNAVPGSSNLRTSPTENVSIRFLVIDLNYNLLGYQN